MSFCAGAKEEEEGARIRVKGGFKGKRKGAAVASLGIEDLPLFGGGTIIFKQY